MDRTVKVHVNPSWTEGTPEWFADTTDWCRETLKKLRYGGNCMPFAHKIPDLKKCVANETQGAEWNRRWDIYCAEALDADDLWIDAIERGVLALEREGYDGTITLNHALERASTAERARAAPDRIEMSRPQGAPTGNSNALKTQDKNKPDNVRFESIGDRGGNSSDYLAARLKRDAPTIARRLAAGEFKSVRAAAIEAGIVKPEDHIAGARRALQKLDPNERIEVVIETVDGMDARTRGILLKRLKTKVAATVVL